MHFPVISINTIYIYIYIYVYIVCVATHTKKKTIAQRINVQNEYEHIGCPVFQQVYVGVFGMGAFYKVDL